MSPEGRAQYRAQWADIQEQFVESPQRAVTAADALLAGLARDRGFPDGEQFEEQLAALSVHHAAHVHGYRSVHTAACAGSPWGGSSVFLAPARPLVRGRNRPCDR